MKTALITLFLAIAVSLGCDFAPEEERANARRSMSIELARAINDRVVDTPADCKLPTAYWETREALKEQIRLWTIVLSGEPSDDHIVAAIAARSAFVQHNAEIYYECKDDEQ